jgi:PAS domain S-box-containing protein
VSTRLRRFGAVGVVLVLTAVGFFVARALGELDARRDSSHRADIAATRVRDRVAQAATLVDGIRRFLADHSSSGVTTEQFADIGASWLAPVGLPAAAWVERVPAAERAGYELRTGHRIVVPTAAGGLARAGPGRTYLPATLVTRSPPMSAPGIDLVGSPGIAAAVARPQTAYRVSATPLWQLADGTTGLFLVQSAQRLDRGVVEPGYVVLFLPSSWLLAGAADTGASNPTTNPRLQIRAGGGSAGNVGDGATARSTFAAAGQPFEVRVPRGGVHGAAEALPWIVGAGGLLLAALAGALGVIAARRTRATAEVDRLFTLSPDLIVVAGFDGYFKRVNPAFEAQLGYTQLEALARPYVDFVHPDDRERTKAESSRLHEGEMTVSFENRYVCKNGSYRWFEWTAAPVLEERLIYAVARDVTERRRAEADLREAEERNRSLAKTQAALRRVATLVAEGVPPAQVFSALGEEVNGLLDAGNSAIARLEADGTVKIVANCGTTTDALALGTRLKPEPGWLLTAVIQTGRAARKDDYDDASGGMPVVIRDLGIHSSVAAPIAVEGELWGVIILGTQRARFPDDTEQRLEEFTELAATAIANAATRSELAASRARIVAASDETRRRIERDLHDGTQQRLVSLSLDLRLAESTVPAELHEHRGTIGRVAEELNGVIDELREISRGIHPAILSEGGLAPALRTLARRSATPMKLDDAIENRLPEPIEVAAYYVVSEALANTTKHAHASQVQVALGARNGSLRLSIHDDGVGGADPAGGSGLVGLRDRVEALGGSIEIRSPAGEGTHVVVELPLELDLTVGEFEDTRPARIPTRR